MLQLGLALSAGLLGYWAAAGLGQLGSAAAGVAALAASCAVLLSCLLFNQHRHRQLAQRRDQLKSRFAKLMLALDNSPYAVLFADLRGRPLYVNERLAQLLNTPRERLLASNLAEEAPRFGLSPALYQDVVEHLRGGREWTGELFYPEATGGGRNALTSVRSVADASGRQRHVLALAEIVDDELALGRQLYLQANYDPLTGLPNRNRSLARLELLAETAQRQGDSFSLIYIDIDRIRVVNDSLGRANGDTLLSEAAARLRSGLGPGDHLGHLGGDKFLVLLAKRSADAVGPLVSALKLQLREPFTIGGHSIAVTASFGIADYPRDEQRPLELLHCAESAATAAKARGGDTIARYRPAPNQCDSASRLLLENGLRNALQRDELALAFQPVIALGSNRLLGAEVLLRWHNAELGNPGPEQFIPIAEESGLIMAIGDWVLKNACRQAAGWSDAELGPLRIAVNISARQLQNDHILFSIRDALEQSGLAPERLELEVTEQLLVGDSAEVRDRLQRIKELGVRLALDDFGTGYASLSYLKHYPFDVLKIDRSFVRDAASADDSRTLTSAIIAMAHALGMEVVAEGVEQPEQRQFLRERGCDMAQGFLFSAPVAPEHFCDWAERYQALQGQGRELSRA